MATDVALIVVCLCIGCVCVLVRRVWSRCCLGGWLGLAQRTEPCVRWGSIFRTGKVSF